MSETVIIGPDGTRYVFPAGVTPEKMREVMRRRYRRGEYYQRMDQGREMIMGSNVRDRSGAQMAAGQYLAEDQLRQDIEAGRQQARAEEMIAEPDIGRERFMTAAQGLTLGAAPYLQGGAQGLAAGAMFPFLSPEQRERLGGPNIGDVVGEQASRGYQTARADIERAREARPLESLGLELVGGFNAIKSIYDDIGQRYFRNQTGVRGGISGAGGGAQYGLLESEGSPEETALAASIGGIGGAGIAKALQATAGPVGRMFNRMTGRQVEPEPVMEPAGTGAGYFGRQSMRAARDRGPSERVLAMQADWAPVQPNIGNARAAANAAGRLAQEATNLRGADRQTAIQRASNAIQAVRKQVQDIQAQRAGMATPEDQRLQDIIDLLEPTSDPVLLQTQATMVQQNLARINQAIGLEEVPRSMPPQQSAARRLGFQPTVRDETAVARPRPVAGRYAGAGDDIQPMGFGASAPKTPQQAVRFETPGSPEYEAAVAKGLDMSTPARMARAKEMGFNTDTVFFHGTATDGPIQSFRSGKRGDSPHMEHETPAIFFSDDPNTAQKYARSTAENMRARKSSELFDAGKDVEANALYNDTIDGRQFEDAALAMLPPDVRRIVGSSIRSKGIDSTNRKAFEELLGKDKAKEFFRLVDLSQNSNVALPSGQQIYPVYLPSGMREVDANIFGGQFDKVIYNALLKESKEAGYKGLIIRNVIDSPTGYGDPSTVAAIFDPANIRSVNAAFDPEKSSSPELLAGIPFALGGAGLGMGAMQEEE